MTKTDENIDAAVVRMNESRWSTNEWWTEHTESCRSIATTNWILKNINRNITESENERDREYRRIARVRNERMDRIHRWLRSRRSMSLRWRVDHWDCREWHQRASLSFDCWPIRDDEASTDYFEDRRMNLETHRHIHHHDSSHDCSDTNNCPAHHSFSIEMRVGSIDCNFRRFFHSSILVDNWRKCLHSIDCSRANTLRRDADHHRHSKLSHRCLTNQTIGVFIEKSGEISRNISIVSRFSTKSNIDPQCRSNRHSDRVREILLRSKWQKKRPWWSWDRSIIDWENIFEHVELEENYFVLDWNKRWWWSTKET